MNRRQFLATSSPKALNQNMEKLSAKVHVFDDVIDGKLTRRYVLPVTVSPDFTWDVAYEELS